MKLVKGIIVLNVLFLINSCGGGTTSSSIIENTNEIILHQKYFLTLRPKTLG